MKILRKTIIPLFLAIILTACGARTQDAIAVSTGAIETAPLTATLPPTEILVPTSAISFSGTPTVIPMDLGLTWSECVVPNRDYSIETADMGFLKSCIDTPVWSENDKKRIGERVSGQEGDAELRITIGSDYFETKHDNSKELWTYELIKNGEVILKINPSFMAHDPNRNFWNIEGKLVWELAGSTAMIVVDGVNYNEKYQLEGSFFPYEIKGKLIYIAKENGKYHIVYDDKVMGPEFDDIQMAYCCSMASVYHGSEQYWFLGRRAGTKFIISFQ